MTRTLPETFDPAWLPILLDGVLSEIYMMDCDTLDLIHANHAACKNLQRSVTELTRLTLPNVTQELSPSRLARVLQPLRSGKTAHTEFATTLVRRDGTTYPIHFRLSLAFPVLIAIGIDQTETHASAQALGASESRFYAIVSNMPGLVFQVMRKQDGEISFPYLSDGCHALLGISAARLRANPALFVKMILADDRLSYLNSMAESARTLTSWNWEGRIWIEKWKDTKWINLRATPRLVEKHGKPAGLAWDGVMTNITQSRVEQDEIRRSRAQLAELSAHIERVKEQERTRIAREIHDDLGGNLTAIKMAMALLIRRLPENTPELLEKAGYIDALADRSIESVHRIAADLRPGILDFGIVAALEWHAREFEKQVGVPCRFTSNREDIQLDAPHATALFRIFQEALTNIAKHARATEVIVKLAVRKRCITLEVADNGVGMNISHPVKPRSFGIRGMEERANMLGGKFTISQINSGGCLVTIKVPMSIA